MHFLPMNQNRTNETLGYIVLEEGSGTIGDWSFVAGTGPRIVRGPDNIYNPYDGFSYTFNGITNATSAIASISGMNGENGAWAALLSFV